VGRLGVRRYLVIALTNLPNLPSVRVSVFLSAFEIRCSILSSPPRSLSSNTPSPLNNEMIFISCNGCHIRALHSMLQKRMSTDIEGTPQETRRNSNDRSNSPAAHASIWSMGRRAFETDPAVPGQCSAHGEGLSSWRHGAEHEYHSMRSISASLGFTSSTSSFCPCTFSVVLLAFTFEAPKEHIS
jgi:hypothetical protein